MGGGGVHACVCKALVFVGGGMGFQPQHTCSIGGK